jgi:DNA-binding CsgD family transcriptional regulator
MIIFVRDAPRSKPIRKRKNTDYKGEGVDQADLMSMLGAAQQQVCTGEVQFTDRQFMVASMLGSGKSIKETAAELSLSPKTVEFHLKSVYVMLNVRNYVEIAHWLIKRKLIPVLDL